MPNSLRSQRNGVLEVLAISVVGLTSMKECWHWHFLHFWLFFDYNLYVLLGCENLLSEITYLWGIVFFINHVETSDKLS
jgi:hypothetical protein